jgi:hypothetical protein
MTLIQVLPVLPATRPFWLRTVGTEIFWPWYTLIGAAITLVVTFLCDAVFGTRARGTGSLAP